MKAAHLILCSTLLAVNIEAKNNNKTVQFLDDNSLMQIVEAVTKRNRTSMPTVKNSLSAKPSTRTKARRDYKKSKAPRSRKHKKTLTKKKRNEKPRTFTGKKGSKFVKIAEFDSAKDPKKSHKKKNIKHRKFDIYSSSSDQIVSSRKGKCCKTTSSSSSSSCPSHEICQNHKRGDYKKRVKVSSISSSDLYYSKDCSCNSSSSYSYSASSFSKSSFYLFTKHKHTGSYSTSSSSLSSCSHTSSSSSSSSSDRKHYGKRNKGKKAKVPKLIKGKEYLVYDPLMQAFVLRKI